MWKRFNARIVFNQDDIISGGTGDDFSEEISALFDEHSVDVEPEVEDPPQQEDLTPSEEPTEVSADDAEEPVENPDEGEDTSEPVIESESEPVINDVQNNKIAALEAQIETLTNLVEKLSGGEQKSEISEPDPQIQVPGFNLEEQFKDIDFDAMLDSKENFFGVMNKFMQLMGNQVAETVMTNVPQVVGAHVTRNAALRDAAAKFYDQYPELKRVKRYVGMTANEVQAENPEWTLGKIFDETAKRVKESLNIQDVIEEEEKQEASKPKPTPVLPGAGSTRTPTPVPNALQDEIDDFLSD